MVLGRKLASWLIIGLLAATQACVSNGDGDSDDDDGDELRSCESMCSEAQGRDCTAITGDCDAFCSALSRAAPKGGCEDERSSLHECESSRDDVCEPNCNGLESALEDCMGAYCLANAGDNDCAVLLASY